MICTTCTILWNRTVLHQQTFAWKCMTITIGQSSFQSLCSLYEFLTHGSHVVAFQSNHADFTALTVTAKDASLPARFGAG